MVAILLDNKFITHTNKTQVRTIILGKKYFKGSLKYYKMVNKHCNKNESNKMETNSEKVC